MIYIYDILLNFCDSDNLYDFYEWDSNDCIENIKRIKLVHVNSDMIDDLIKYDLIINKDFLLKIYRTCDVYHDSKVKTLDYCLLFSDGDRVIAIEFNKNGEIISKSFLLLEEEEEIALLASNLEITDIKYIRSKKIYINRLLTRNEVNIRRYLIKEIEDSYTNKKYKKLKYLYQEYFDKDNNSNINMKNELINSMSDCIDEKHLNLYNLLRLTKIKKQV